MIVEQSKIDLAVDMKAFLLPFYICKYFHRSEETYAHQKDSTSLNKTELGTKIIQLKIHATISKNSKQESAKL